VYVLPFLPLASLSLSVSLSLSLFLYIYIYFCWIFLLKPPRNLTMSEMHKSVMSDNLW
jgi:hypothetical protein